METQIAVVGGGFAGLAAAYELFNFGIAVTVLEARQRVGGRVWSTKLSNGAIVELGGEWISSGDHTVIKLAKRLDLSLVKVGVDFKMRDVVNGLSVSPDDQRKTLQVATETLAAMDETSRAQSTLGGFLDDLIVSEAQKALLRSRLQCSFGTDLHNIALRMLGDYSLGENRNYYRVATGNQSLAKAMAAQLPDVRLGHMVTEIIHHQRGASIKTKSAHDTSDVKVDGVIMAIPVKRLVEIKFNPVLEQTIAEAISSVPMGVAAKLAVGTRNSPPLRAIQDIKMPYWCWTGNGEGDVPRAAVTAFCGSKEAQQNLVTMSNDPSIWLNKLQSANPDLDFLNNPIMVDWSQDEWTRGCYSAFDNRATDLIPILSQPVGRIFFAGEHTAEESATMEGALASGLHAAREISEVL